MKATLSNNIILLIVIFSIYCTNRNNSHINNNSFNQKTTYTPITGTWISLDSKYKLNIDSVRKINLIETKNSKIILNDSINNFSNPFLKGGIEIYTLKNNSIMEIRNYLNGFLTLIEPSESKSPLLIRFRKCL